jgi:CheY-like chemotaxis protein
MATQSLVVSSDPIVLGQLRPLMNEFGMDMHSCHEHEKALTHLKREKFDTVIIDCDEDPNGLELLTNLRQNPAHQKTVAVGITSNVYEMQQLFDSGATFVLSKPLPLEDARRILRISKGVITRVVRRFLRLEVGNMATATLGDDQESIILNISQRGLAVQAPRPLKRGQMIYVTFLLPNTFHLVEGMAEVMWCDILGRCGLEFRALAPEMQEEMSRWVFAMAKEQNVAIADPMPPKIKEEIAAAKIVADEMQRGPSLVKLGTKTKTVIVDVSTVAAKHSKTAAMIMFGALVDLLVVGLGTVLFFGFGAIFGHDKVAPTLAIAVGIAFWAIYRFLFFFFNVHSLGEKTVHGKVQARGKIIAETAGRR